MSLANKLCINHSRLVSLSFDSHNLFASIKPTWWTYSMIKLHCVTVFASREWRFLHDSLDIKSLPCTMSCAFSRYRMLLFWFNHWWMRLWIMKKLVLWYRHSSLDVSTTIKSKASFSTKYYYTIHCSVNCEISTYIGIETWFHLKTLLSNDDIASNYCCASEDFDAAIFRIGISSIFGTTCSFDVSHVCLLKLKRYTEV